MAIDQLFMIIEILAYQIVLNPMVNLISFGITLNFMLVYQFVLFIHLQIWQMMELLFLNKLNIEKSHLIGQSMGGMITQRMVSDHNDRFLSYVLISSMAKTRFKYSTKGRAKKAYRATLI